ncbi:Uncharacterised protein [uncultured archaeon]|nr:Uncharacterised protein [uncultured archaeon]
MAEEASGKAFQNFFEQMTKQMSKAFSGAGTQAKEKKGEAGGVQAAMKPKKAGGEGTRFQGSYSLETPGKPAAAGEASVKIDGRSLEVLPKFSEPVLVPLRSVTGFTAKDYRVELQLNSGEKLAVYDLGYEYENFLRLFSGFMNNAILEGLLAHEKVVKSGVEANYAYCAGTEGTDKREGKCKARIYDSALVVIPDEGEMLRVPFGSVYAIADAGNALNIFTDYGGKLELSMMGYEFEPFSSALAKAYQGMLANEQAALSSLLPEADPLQVRKVASVMKEGKAVTKPEIDSAAPGIWEMIEKRLQTLGLREGFDYLKSLSTGKGIAIGVKQGLGWGTADYYLWFLVPIYSQEKGKPGNAVAMEVPGKGNSKATYFFRLAGRGEYGKLGIRELEARGTELVKRLSACMIAINFRREPIYLPAEKLELPEHEKYRVAVQKIPELRMLRELFIGRVIHSSDAAWKKDVNGLLSFNVSAKSDAEKWAKFAESTESEEKEGEKSGEQDNPETVTKTQAATGKKKKS